MTPYPAPPVAARVLRVVVALAVVAAVVATVVDISSRTTLQFFNFFGFFTVQSNLLLAAVYLVITPAARPRSARAAELLSLVRASVATYIVIVGVVYGLLLAPLGEAGGVPVPWANTVLHIVTPVYGLLDWIVFRDRSPLAARRVWVVLLYPLVWLVVVLVRGATDGWVPYPFLDPANGYGSVAVVCVGILLALLVVGSLVFAVSRSHPATPSH
ncbi:Pr6Pr family membrane protein [Nakamurella deserti]|uniref:Pr6Pr family membrane protein n=1 Tax=Nakamurella deserti TaxID=2164074 RepID=UPI000DBE055A|nr:Pr6Pr family membrane protein [Nakamurella deserti]